MSSCRVGDEMTHGAFTGTRAPTERRGRADGRSEKNADVGTA